MATEAEPVVFIGETLDDELVDGRVDMWASARFCGHVEPGCEQFDNLPLAEALAWARARASRVVLRVVGFGAPFSAGFDRSPSYRPWPESLTAQVARRRVPGEEWKDRTDADPPITWRATVALAPPPATATDPTHRTAHESIVAAVASHATAVAWDAHALDRYSADLAAGTGATWWSPTFTLYVEVDASSEAVAHARAIERIGPLPEGWHASASLEPADDTESHPSAAEQAPDAH